MRGKVYVLFLHCVQEHPGGWMKRNFSAACGRDNFVEIIFGTGFSPYSEIKSGPEPLGNIKKLIIFTI